MYDNLEEDQKAYFHKLLNDEGGFLCEQGHVMVHKYRTSYILNTVCNKCKNQITVE